MIGTHLMPLALVLGAALCAAALSHLTARLVIASAGRYLVDHPGPRSAHLQATARGGGVGIAVVLLAAVGAMAGSGVWPLSWPLSLVGIFLVAVVGFVDDLRSQPVPLRLAAHLAAALAIVAALAGLPAADGSWPWRLGTVVAIAWSINLHNFMDGIDGLLGLQAVWFGLVYAVLFALAGEAGMTLFAILLAGACLGFLPLNLPRARVFLGDGGAGTIGLAIALLAAFGAATRTVPLALGLILASAFLVDSGATLALRVLRGERFWQAHREHLYQRLARSGVSHLRVGLGYLAWNLAVALPALLLARAADGPARTWIALAVFALGLCLWWALRRRCIRGDAAGQAA